jgi:putative FmdB family regulatory protein
MPTMTAWPQMFGTDINMPLYDLICDECGCEFSELLKQNEEPPECPNCHTKEKVRKRISKMSWNWKEGKPT